MAERISVKWTGGCLAEVFRRMPQKRRVWQLYWGYGKQSHEPRLPPTGHTVAVNASTSSHSIHTNVAGEKKNVITFDTDNFCVGVQSPVVARGWKKQFKWGMIRHASSETSTELLLVALVQCVRKVAVHLGYGRVQLNYVCE